MASHAPGTMTAAASGDKLNRQGRRKMDHCNTLAAAYAATSKARNLARGGGREEARAQDANAVHTSPSPVRGDVDQAMLLEVLRRSAGPCDRVFASRIGHCIGRGSVL
jgi:hypothetical protein